MVNMDGITPASSETGEDVYTSDFEWSYHP